MIYLRSQYIFRYAINDDINMRNFISGRYTGEFESRLIHIKYVIGWFLKVLYSVYSNIEWYAVMLLAVQSAGLGVMIFRILSMKEKRIDKSLQCLVLILIIGTLWIPYFVNVQYTLVAALTGVSAIFWYITGKNTVFDDTITVMLALLAYSIRHEVGIVVFALGVGVFVYKNWPLKPSVSVYRVFIMGGIGVVTILLIQSFAYKSKEWKDFFDFNEVRTELYDYYGFPDYADNQGFYNEAEISWESYKAMLDSNMLLNGALNLDKYEAVLNKSKELQQTGIIEHIIRAVKLVGSQFLSDQYRVYAVFSIILWGMVLCTLIRRGDRWKLLWSTFIIVIIASLWLYLGYRGRLPERVAVMMHLFGAIIPFAILIDLRTIYVNQSGVRIFAIGAAICTLLLTNGFTGYKLKQEQQEQKTQLYMADRLEEYFGDNSENFYFVDVYSLAAYTGALKLKVTPEYNNYMRMGDWPVYSPHCYKKLELEKTTNILDTLVNDDHCFMVVLDWKNIDYIKGLLWKTYGDVTCDIIDTITDGQTVFNVYRFKIMK